MAFVHFVIAGRNDNHGFVTNRETGEWNGQGTFKDKIIAVMKWNHALFMAVGLAHRFVFVEWGQFVGPTGPRDWLSPELAAAVDTCHCIEVPDAIVVHKQKPPVSFTEFAAKNVGLVRCKPFRVNTPYRQADPNELLVATNSDVFFPPDCVTWLRDLVVAHEQIYRCQRKDFSSPDMTPNVTRWLRMSGPTEAAGDFTAATWNTWNNLRGYVECPYSCRHLDSEFCVTGGQRTGRDFIFGPPVWHRDHPDSTGYSPTLASLGGGAATGDRNKYNQHWGLSDHNEEPVMARVVRLVPR